MNKNGYIGLGLV